MQENHAISQLKYSVYNYLRTQEKPVAINQIAKDLNVKMMALRTMITDEANSQKPSIHLEGGGVRFVGDMSLLFTPAFLASMNHRTDKGDDRSVPDSSKGQISLRDVSTTLNGSIPSVTVAPVVKSNGGLGSVTKAKELAPSVKPVAKQEVKPVFEQEAKPVVLSKVSENAGKESKSDSSILNTEIELLKAKLLIVDTVIKSNSVVMFTAVSDQCRTPVFVSALSELEQAGFVKVTDFSDFDDKVLDKTARTSEGVDLFSAMISEKTSAEVVQVSVAPEPVVPEIEESVSEVDLAISSVISRDLVVEDAGALEILPVDDPTLAESGQYDEVQTELNFEATSVAEEKPVESAKKQKASPINYDCLKAVDGDSESVKNLKALLSAKSKHDVAELVDHLDGVFAYISALEEETASYRSIKNMMNNVKTAK